MKLAKGERRQIKKALRALAGCQALIAGDLPAPLLQKLKLDEGIEGPEEAVDQILCRLIRLEDGIKDYLIKGSSRKGRAALNEPRLYLTQHYTKCKNPKCFCRTGIDPTKKGHGPYWLGSVRYGKKGEAKTHWYHLGACQKVSREAALQLLQDYAEGRKVKGLPEEPAQPSLAAQTAQEGLTLAIKAAQAAEEHSPAPAGPAELPEALQKKEKPRTEAKGEAKAKPSRITANLPPEVQRRIQELQQAQKGKALQNLLPSPSAPKVLKIWEPAQPCPICLKKLGVKAGSVVCYETIEQPVHYSCLLKLAVKLHIDSGICKIVYHLNEADIIKVEEILRRPKK
jgi:hypothetical protein